MSAAEERLANDPSSELWGEHRSRYRFAIEGSGVRGSGSGVSRVNSMPSPGLVVLDVACGAGFGLDMLRQAGASPIGVGLRRAAPCLKFAEAVCLASAPWRCDVLCP